MRLQKGRVYVSYMYGRGGVWYAAVRVPPEPMIVLRTNSLLAGSFANLERYVFSVWPDAIRIPSEYIQYAPIDNRPPAQSLRGKI